jgi:hypothetical protein
MISSRIFRSRWAALLWAAGILWTAVEVAGTAQAPEPQGNEAAVQTDALGQPVSNEELAILANAMG